MQTVDRARIMSNVRKLVRFGETRLFDHPTRCYKLRFMLALAALQAPRWRYRR
jgi:hypothetical protein